MVPLCLVQFYLNESSFTEPFILGNLQRLLLPILIISSGKGTQDTIEEDDGVIFIGNSESNRLAIHTSEGQPISEQ